MYKYILFPFFCFSYSVRRNKINNFRRLLASHVVSAHRADRLQHSCRLLMQFACSRMVCIVTASAVGTRDAFNYFLLIAFVLIFTSRDATRATTTLLRPFPLKYQHIVCRYLVHKHNQMQGNLE